MGKPAAAAAAATATPAGHSYTSFAEDEFGKKLDRCGTDALVKGAGGLFVGTVLSLLFFKRRRFPIVLGTGFGLGVAYRNCEEELNASK